ncbi:MAG: type II toxin-antitoxin system VapC family toxin [Propionibacteriales bacterium]|nr:type II toxin-antitoxin system VapC family toxin [Propionibacteriales bacterium]
MIVCDAGVLVSAVADHGSSGAQARELLGSQPLHAPYLVDIEVVSALRGLVRGGSAEPAAALAALARFAELSVIRHEHEPLLARIWELRDDVTAYDAAYVALAELLDVPLLTGDAGLARAADDHCEVRLIVGWGQRTGEPSVADVGLPTDADLACMGVIRARR